jgi:hypothetical protein
VSRPQKLLDEKFKLFSGVFGASDVAFVGIKLCGNISRGIRSARLELRVTALADANDRGMSDFHNPQFALLHDCSLAHPEGGGITPVWEPNG